MKTSEFRAWFEGFTENIEGAPSEAQFAKIKAKVIEIDEVAVTERIYVDRYVQPWRPYWDRYWSYTGDSPKTLMSGSLSVEHDDSVVPMNVGVDHLMAMTPERHRRHHGIFDSHSAMRELGRMEAMAA